MWRKAIQSLFTRKERARVHRILMLGLAAGGEIKTLNAFFPHCDVTAVEYDPTMVEIARELKLYKPFPFPRVLVEDAATAVHSLKGERFDFIIVDMFSGPTPSALSQDEHFIQSLGHLVAEDGHVLVNILEKINHIWMECHAYLKKKNSGLTNKICWGFLLNDMDHSKPPFNFSPPEAWPEYGFIAEPAKKYKREELEDGIRYSSWPYYFEEHIGDAEPDTEQSGMMPRIKKIIWKRIARIDTPDGWTVEQHRPWRVDGFFELTNSSYRDTWHRNAKRNLENWHQQKDEQGLHIELISFTEFVTAYKQSSTFQKAGSYFIDILERKWKLLHEYRPLLWGVRQKDGRIIAGTAVHFFESRGATVLECPFFLAEAKDTHAATGLIDYWFGQSLLRHIPLLINIYLWQKGDPADWEKLTQFKNSFGFVPYEYPPLLCRYVRGKLF